MQLSLKEKSTLIDQINDFINDNLSTENKWGDILLDYPKISLLLGKFDIECNDTNYITSLKIADHSAIKALANYVGVKKDGDLADLFHDKIAIDILRTNERFSNLNLYLIECYECIKQNRKIATAILLRSCVEILLDLLGYRERNLAKSIDSFFEKIKSSQEFSLFYKNDKQSELKYFFEGIKDFGNDVAHLNGKSVKDFIERYENIELLKLFCILIESSVLKEEINKKNEEDKENRVKSINFNFKQENYGNRNQPNISSEVDDDDIPF